MDDLITSKEAARIIGLSVSGLHGRKGRRHLRPPLPEVHVGRGVPSLWSRAEEP